LNRFPNGLSDHQGKEALRVATVPEADFERQVESPTPPTVTELARQGSARPGRPPASSATQRIVDLNGRHPEELNRAIPSVGAVEYALRILEKLDLKAVPLLPPKERARALNLVGRIDVIAERIVVKMGEGRSVPRHAP
jgi:hypothetical protein